MIGEGISAALDSLAARLEALPPVAAAHPDRVKP